MPSSDVTARKLGSDFDWLAVNILHELCEIVRLYREFSRWRSHWRTSEELLLLFVCHWDVKNYIPSKKAHCSSSYQGEMCSWIDLYKLRKVVDISNGSARASELSKSCPQFVAHIILLVISPLVVPVNERPRVTSLKRQNIAALITKRPRRMKRFWRALKIGSSMLFTRLQSLYMLSTDAYKQGLIGGIAVDEGHCI